MAHQGLVVTTPTNSATLSGGLRKPAGGQASPLFFDHVFQDRIVESQIGHDMFETAVFVFQVPQPLNAAHVHAAIGTFPAVVRGLADGMGATDIANFLAVLNGFEDCNDLFFTKPLCTESA